MGGSKKAPKQTDEQRANERKTLELQQRQLDAANKPIDMPKIAAPKAALPPPPPPAQSSADVTQAEEEARRKAARRTNTSRGTLFAGETGGYGGVSLGGSKTLLG